MYSYEFPSGFRFKPNAEEIFTFYLPRAIGGQSMPSKTLVEREIYGENKEPWNIFNKDAEEPSWVSTKLKKKSKTRIDRIAGCGWWRAVTSEQLRDENGQVLGWQKTFVFNFKKKGQPSNQGNDLWTMHEFSLNDENLSHYVICKIMNKGSRKPPVQKLKSPEINDEENHDLIKNQDAADRKNKKRKPEVNDEAEMIPAALKNVRLDDQENPHLTLPQNPTPVSTINPIVASLGLRHESSVDESKENEQDVDKFLSDLLREDPYLD